MPSGLSHDQWKKKWQKMAKRAFVIGFSGHDSEPKAEDGIIRTVKRQLARLGVAADAGPVHGFLELGWSRKYCDTARESIRKYLRTLPGNAEPRVVLFGHSYGAGSALNITAGLARKGVPVAGLGMSDENKPRWLTYSRNWVPPNIERAYNAYGGGSCSWPLSLSGRRVTPRNPNTTINADQHFRGKTHAKMKNDCAVTAAMARMIAEAVGVRAEG